MKILKLKEIDATTGTYFIDLMNDREGNACAENIYIQVEEDADVLVSGTVSDSANSVDIAIIQCADMSVVSAISASGLYVVDGSGLSSITLGVTGETKIIIKVLG